MSSGIGDYLRSRGAAWDDAPDDVLDAGVIWKIEHLHSAVLEMEGERRFGRSVRSEELTALQAEEQELLEAHGFTSYNDFRLRVRRSTAVAPPPAADERTVAAEAAEEAEPAPSPGGAAGTWEEPPGSPEQAGPPEHPDVTARGSEPPAPIAPQPEALPATPAPGLVVLGRGEGASAAGVVSVEEWAMALRREFDRHLAERVRQAQS
jgi:hypothetical protein